jgi:hypothetical protein
MFDLFLRAMIVAIISYSGILVIWLTKISIDDRMSKGETLGQAIKGVIKDIFWITKVGK